MAEKRKGKEDEGEEKGEEPEGGRIGRGMGGEMDRVMGDERDGVSRRGLTNGGEEREAC